MRVSPKGVYGLNFENLSYLKFFKSSLRTDVNKREEGNTTNPKAPCIFQASLQCNERIKFK